MTLKIPAGKFSANPSEERLPRWKKLVYGLGGFAENFFHNALNIMATPFLNIGFGVSPAWVSTAMTVPRLLDAFLDPVMGGISDNFRSRFGRRRPFIFIGGFLTSFLFGALWWIPKGLGPTGTFWTFLGMLLLYYIVFTVFIVPYLALGFELTPSYNERTRLMGYKSFFSVLAGFAMNWLYWLTQRDVFDGIVEGMRWVGMGCGLLLMVATAIPAILLRESHQALPMEKGKGEKHAGLMRSLWESVSNRPFLLVLGTCVSVIVGVLLTMQIGMYLNIYYVAGGDQKLASTIQGISGSCYQVTSLLAVPVVSWAGTRLGKRVALMTILSFGVAGSLSSWFLITPRHPYLQIVSLFFTAPAIAGLWIIAPSMIADVCDCDADRYGAHREGIFGATYGWFTKLSSSLAILTSGFVLVWTGFDVHLGVAQGAGTLSSMRFLNALVPAVFFALAIHIISRYPISEAKAAEIRQRLEGKAAGL